MNADIKTHDDVMKAIETSLGNLLHRSLASLSEEEKLDLKKIFEEDVRPLDGVKKDILSRSLSEWTLFDGPNGFVANADDPLVRKIATTERFGRFAVTHIDKTAKTCTLTDTETHRAYPAYIPNVAEWREGTVVEFRVAKIDDTLYPVGLINLLETLPADDLPELPKPIHGSQLLGCVRVAAGEDGRFADQLKAKEK